MGLLDKIKKLFVGEHPAPTKPKNIDSTNQNIPTKQKVVDTVVVENKPKQISLEEMFKENEDYIFENIILDNLFNDENKYSDSSIFEKTQTYLKKYFEDNGFDWNSNSALIKNLISTSQKFKAIAKQQNSFYEYFCVNKIDFKFEGHFPDWVKYVVDQSYIANKPLTKQYARILVGYYYFKALNTKGSKDALYKKLLAMISYEEFKNWIKSDTACFDRLVYFVIKRFNKMDVQDLDERILLTQLIKSKNFTEALKEFNYLDASAKQSKYASIYNEVNKNTNINTIDLNVRNVINEEKNSLSKNETRLDSKQVEIKNKVSDNPQDSIDKSTAKKDDAIKKIIDVPRDTSEKEIIAETSTQNKTTNNQISVSKIVSQKSLNEEDDFDKVLEKLGGSRDVKTSAEVEFLNSIVEDLKKIEEEKIIESESTTEQPYDEEIENLLYL